MVVGDKMYKLIGKDEWVESKERCVDIGLRLVEIGSIQEELMIDDFLTSKLFIN